MSLLQIYRDRDKKTFTLRLGRELEVTYLYHSLRDFATTFWLIDGPLSANRIRESVNEGFETFRSIESQKHLAAFITYAWRATENYRPTGRLRYAWETFLNYKPIVEAPSRVELKLQRLVDRFIRAQKAFQKHSQDRLVARFRHARQAFKKYQPEEKPQPERQENFEGRSISNARSQKSTALSPFVQRAIYAWKVFRRLRLRVDYARIAFREHPELSKKQAEVANSLKGLALDRKTTLFEPVFEQQFISFGYLPESSDSLIFPRDLEGFVSVFRTLWARSEEDILLLVEEAWKWLYPQSERTHETLGTVSEGKVNDFLRPKQKEELATYLIAALNHPDLKHWRDRENLSWHYCAWHKYGWEAARDMAALEKEEQASIAWLEVCFRTEPIEPALLTEIDPEREIKEVIFSEKQESRRSMVSPPAYLRRRETERKTLSHLARWFVRRYDLETALQIFATSGQSKLITRLAKLAVRLPFVSRDGVPRIGALIWVTVLVPYLLIKVFPSIVTWLLPLVALLFILFLMIQGKQFLVRLAGGCVIGWLPLLSDEFLHIPTPHYGIEVEGYVWLWSWSYWFIPIAIGAVYYSVHTKVKQSISQSWITKNWFGLVGKRTMVLTLVGLILSGLIGVFICRYSVPPVLMDTINDYKDAGEETISLRDGTRVDFKPDETYDLADWLSVPGSVLGIFSVQAVYGKWPEIFPTYVWLFYTPIALFIGIFIQLLWEEKPMTEPL